MAKFSCLFMVLIWGSVAHAGLSFAPIFNDGAVLQCDLPVNVWGTADPAETVTVSFAGQEKTAVAGDSGQWQVVLDPLKASSLPRTLQVSSFEFQVSIADVLVGEVWLATGQSNMVMPLRNSTGGADRLKRTIPEIRFMNVPQQTGLPPQPMTAEQLAWKAFKPGPNNEIAAVAFYFAEYLQQQLGGVVGIIQSSYGGTPAEAWTPAWALEQQPALSYLADAIQGGLASGKTTEQWQKEKDAFWDFWRARREWAKTKQGPEPKPVPRPGPDNPLNQQAPTVLYENMIKPLIPYTARGILWYQGESNAGKPDEYRILFPTMIETWRKVWERPDWPFFFVQISAFDHPTQDWPGLRDAQRFTRDTVPHTGMALSIDCGEKKEIHPWAKQPVGERLGLLALDQVYGRDVVSRGPVFQRLETKGNCILVTFQTLENGSQASRRLFQALETSDGKPDVPGFEVAGQDGEYHPAAARIISKDTVELTCPDVEAPVSVRYAWHNWIEPPVTLQNRAGLPAEPFMQALR